MVTPLGQGDLLAVLFGKTRRAVLSLLFRDAEEDFYLRQLGRVAGVGLGALQRELQRLSRVGLIRRTVRGRQVYFQADPQCPIFPELKSLVVKTAGISDVLRARLVPLGDRIRLAFLYGSVARGAHRRGSDVDLLVVGDATFAEIVAALGPAQESLGREVNPVVYPPREFRTKLFQGHHFLSSVVKANKIFLIGDARELARLAEKRLAG